MIFSKSFLTLTWCLGIGMAGFVLVVPEVRASGVATPTSVARVRHLGKSKKAGHFIVFDQGSDTGFVIGRDVCFYDGELRKLACAGIMRTRPKAAAVNLEPEDQQRVEKGAYVWPEDLGPLTRFVVERSVASSSEPSKDMDSLSQDEDIPEPLLPPVLKTRTQVHVAPTLSLPIWMTELRFSAGARAAGTGDLWTSGDTIRGSVVGFGLRHHIPQHGDGDWAIDLTYHFVPQRPVRDDFDLTDSTVSVESSVLAHHYRLRWLRGATWYHRDNRDLLLYTGVGYDLMMAKFDVQYVGSRTGKLIDGNISAHALEIPLVIAYQHHWGSFMLTAGADMAIPLIVGGVKPRGTLHYDEDVGNADKSLGSAFDSINVRRGWFSVALQLGLGAAF
jgi:hypothetical protein